MRSLADLVERSNVQLGAPAGLAYQQLGPLYDDWCVTVVEDIPLYRDLCRGADGPIVELGVGSGRIAVELCSDGHEVIGLDASPAMLAIARARAEEAGVADRLTLLCGDILSPPPLPAAARVLAPFRPFMHLSGDDQRRRALTVARDLLLADGRFAFDVFEPTSADVRKTHGRWLEREPGIWERAHWDAGARTVELEVRARGRTVTMTLEWRSADEWRALCESCGLEIVAAFAGFDGASLDNLPGDHVFICGPRRSPRPEVNERER